MGKISRIAKGVPDELVDLARPQFADHDRILGHSSAVSVELVLQRLHDSKINAGLQSFAFSGLTAWIGDPINGNKAEGSLRKRDLGWRQLGSLARWLHETALRLYPDSDYARAYGGGHGH